MAYPHIPYPLYMYFTLYLYVCQLCMTQLSIDYILWFAVIFQVYLGCFVDMTTNRDLEGGTGFGGSMTIEVCIAHCESQGKCVHAIVRCL